MGRQEMHLLVFLVGGHLNFDVFTGFFACGVTSGVSPATLPVNFCAYLRLLSDNDARDFNIAFSSRKHLS